MSAFYFQRDEDISEKPEVLDVMLATGLSVAVVVYHLEEFWRKVNQKGESLNDGTGRGLLPAYRLAHLPLLVGLDDAYWQAVAAAGWVDESAEGLLIPKFDDRFGRLAQARAAATVRQQQCRARRGQGTGVSSQESGVGSWEEGDATVGIHESRDPCIASSDSCPLSPDPCLQRLTGKQLASQFDRLTVADLSVCGTLLGWMADVSMMHRPVVVNDAWHQVRVVAAGIRATTGDGVKEPMALFKSIVGRGRWTMLEPADVQAAQARLETHQQWQASRQVEYRERAGLEGTDETPAEERTNRETRSTEAAELIAGGFGTVPPSSPRVGPDELIRWDQKRKSRTA